MNLYELLPTSLLFRFEIVAGNPGVLAASPDERKRLMSRLRSCGPGGRDEGRPAFGPRPRTIRKSSSAVDGRLTQEAETGLCDRWEALPTVSGRGGHHGTYRERVEVLGWGRRLRRRPSADR